MHNNEKVPVYQYMHVETSNNLARDFSYSRHHTYLHHFNILQDAVSFWTSVLKPIIFMSNVDDIRYEWIRSCITINYLKTFALIKNKLVHFVLVSLHIHTCAFRSMLGLHCVYYNVMYATFNSPTSLRSFPCLSKSWSIFSVSFEFDT